MLKQKTMIAALLAAALILAGGWAWAQGPGTVGQGGGLGIGPGGPGGGPGLFAEGGRHGRMGRRGFLARHLIRALDLTEDQIEQTRQIRQESAEQARAVREQQRALRDELRTQLEGEAPSAESVGSLVISLHQNRQQVRDIHLQAVTDFEAILTPEQLERFQEFKERRQERRGRLRHRGR